jgi:RNA polymerase sigma-70 factor (ECF subfamily)
VDPNRELSRLAGLAREGDNAAFALLVEGCSPPLYNFLLRLVNHPQDAEDLLQDSLIKAHRALHRYDPVRPFLPWLFAIGRRTAMNHWRRRRPETESLDAAAGRLACTEGGPDATAEAADDRAMLWTMVRRLPERQSVALWLCYAEGFENAEIATVLGASRLGVKVILHRARRALFRELNRAGISLSAQDL